MGMAIIRCQYGNHCQWPKSEFGAHLAPLMREMHPPWYSCLGNCDETSTANAGRHPSEDQVSTACVAWRHPGHRCIIALEQIRCS